MTNPTATFFEELSRRGHEPLLGRATGTVRFDVGNGKRTDHWRLEFDEGDLRASRDKSPADCVVRADRKLFDGIAGGEVNAMAALIRGELAIEGDPNLLVLVQRLFPGPAGPSSQRPAPAAERRRP
jgi:putative sterol carrier protein